MYNKCHDTRSDQPRAAFRNKNSSEYGSCRQQVPAKRPLEDVEHALEELALALALVLSVVAAVFCPCCLPVNMCSS